MIFDISHYSRLLMENVSVEDVDSAIDGHKRVIINYHSKGEDNNDGARVVEVYAYGLTKAGNPVIRAFQPFGDTTTKVPSWKFFRLDRISYWKPTNQKFNRPADFYYRGMGEFNPNGDDSMSIVYKIATFNGSEGNINNPTMETPSSGPKLKQQPQTANGKRANTTDRNVDYDGTYKTDTEYNMERTRQQLENPITLSDIKTKNGFKKYGNETPESGPKLKSDADNEEDNSVQSGEEETVAEPKDTQNSNVGTPYDVFKTDTERNMERLRNQLANPQRIDLDRIPRR